MNEMTISFNKNEAQSITMQKGYKFVWSNWILRELSQQGLVFSVESEDVISLTFKNERVKRCLTVSGQILELIVAKIMRELKDKEGFPFYNDVKVGVVIDWDLVDGDTACRTINEIDVLAMKGTVPVFVSCKNGRFDANELYKLNTVAERFGRKYSKKVLVSTSMDELKSPELIRARMEDMGISNIGDADNMTAEELEKALRLF